MAVLVPYDGSHPAKQAVEHAVTEHGDEEIVLFRVIEVASGSIAAGLDIVQERLREEQDRAAGELAEEVADLLDEDVDYRVETAVGQPAREVVSYAEDHDVDRIVIGSHGREGVSHVLLGSVAEKVVQRAPTTVTVVR